MATVKVEYDDRLFADAFSRAALKSVVAQIKGKVGALRCSAHDEAPTVKVLGHSVDTLSFQVAGCCIEVVDQVRARLSTYP